jgi:phosphoribosylformimino-5-aminoimidazole carboxamide ribotide isomerase
MSPTPPIIPVLDLMIGQVVLAQGGRRDDYLPVNTKLTRSSRPLDVAKAIYLQTGCNLFYLADIDSFAGAEPNWRVYQNLLEAGFGLWIDADWLRQDRAKLIVDRLGSRPNLKIIVSSETIQSLDQIRPIAELRQLEIEPIFSLDQRGPAVLSRSVELSQATPLEWILQATAYGIQELILLDLTRVGTSQGVEHNDSLCVLLQEIRQELPRLKLTTGGGVKSFDDVASLLTMGCDHVLVASAIHQCKFTHDDVEALSSMQRL